MTHFSTSKRNTFILLFSIVFIVWCSIFIYRTSFIALDGTRYFSLDDDAMISMRYAWNLSHGNGLVWNNGEKVEGFTNFLMTLFMSGFTALLDKKNAVLGVQISGIVWLLLTAYFFMKIAEQLVNSRHAYRETILTLAFIAPLTYYPLLYWTLKGMETGMLACFIAASIYATLYFRDRTTPIIGLLLGCAFLTRPDTAVPIVLILGMRWFLLPANKKITGLILDSGLIAVFVIGMAIFRFVYYGEFVPNTYTLKVEGMDTWFRIYENGLVFLWPFLQSISVALFLGGMLLLLNFQRKHLFFYGFVVIFTLYQLYMGGDPWEYWRYMAPYVPFLFIVIILGLANLIRKMSTFSPKMMLVTLCSAVFLLSNQGGYKELFFIDLPYHTDSNQNNVNIAILLNRIVDQQASIAVLWGGTIPYYTGRPAIDMLGKNDKYIAALPPDISGSVSWKGMKSVPGHNKYDLHYAIVEKQPTYIQVFKWGKQDLSTFVSQYYVPVNVENHTLWLRRNSPHVFWQSLN